MTSGEPTSSNTMHHLTTTPTIPSIYLVFTYQPNGKHQNAQTRRSKKPYLDLNHPSSRPEANTTKIIQPTYHHINSKPSTSSSRTTKSSPSKQIRTWGVVYYTETPTSNEASPNISGIPTSTSHSPSTKLQFI